MAGFSTNDHRRNGMSELLGTGFGIFRKKRMARQRRSNINVLLPFVTASAADASSHVRELSVNAQQQNLHVPGLSQPLVTEPKMLRFLLQKELRHSDVGTLGRVVLPKRASEAFLPSLDTKDGVFITMYDMDGRGVWDFKFRYWPNNNSRMYVLENTGDFVKTHELQIGDFLMLYKDEHNQKYVIRARKALDLNVSWDGQVLFDSSVRLVPDIEAHKPNYFPVNYSMVDEMDMFFPYNNTFPDLNVSDSISMDIPNFSSLGTVTASGFESFDNFPLDEY
ncbi:hypothetical protein IFM89_032231 [Coptis chinensis]|uniref:TF-B3 domain-containing protein n=1 Tax=Coptis chinensis TaxID=261450 RepID=A0A835HUB2_9MAGN|nr:hypothetical protein IFM89_032231 [Coptis chinensis]